MLCPEDAVFHKAKLALLPLMFLASVAHADKTGIEECIKAKIADSYKTDKQLRTQSSTVLDYGGARHYQTTLLKGQTYHVLTCADKNVRDLDIILYDSKGKIVVRDTLDNREPTLKFIPAATGTYFVTLYVRSMVDHTKKSDVAFSLMFE